MVKRIQNVLGLFYNNHEHTFRNKYIFGWESDFFCVSKSGYCIEVEIKISRGDFRADFNKQKHALLYAFSNGIKYVIERGDETQHYEENLCAKGITDRYIKARNCELTIYSRETTITPNKFYFACPEGLIKENDVPEYAGLMYIGEKSEYPEIIKTAPFIHKNKHDIQKLLFKKYMWGYIEALKQLEELKLKLKDAT